MREASISTHGTTSHQQMSVHPPRMSSATRGRSQHHAITPKTSLETPAGMLTPSQSDQPMFHLTLEQLNAMLAAVARGGAGPVTGPPQGYEPVRQDVHANVAANVSQLHAHAEPSSHSRNPETPASSDSHPDLGSTPIATDVQSRTSMDVVQGERPPPLRQ